MKKKKYYNKNKCECIRGKEIVGMGRPTDEHIICHNCGSSLFPHERYNKYCRTCQTNPYRLSDEPRDKLKSFGFPEKSVFLHLQEKEYVIKQKLWKRNLTVLDKIKITLGIKACNEYDLYTLDEIKNGKK